MYQSKGLKLTVTGNDGGGRERTCRLTTQVLETPGAACPKLPIREAGMYYIRHIFREWRS